MFKYDMTKEGNVTVIDKSQDIIEEDIDNDNEVGRLLFDN